jgi:SAM-dependent methyltransferase
MSGTESWVRAYRESPEIFDAFTRAEDPEGRIVERLLAEADLAGRSVLEIGCGTGRYSEVLAPRAGRFVGIERSRPMLDLACENLRQASVSPALVGADARKLPFRDDCFDTVIAAWVVAHMKRLDRTRALAEASRVAGAGGIWVIENHWEGPFQELRGPERAEVERRRIHELIDGGGFSIVDVIRTELRFSSTAEAERVLGYLCGEAVRAKLRARPVSTVGHHVVILVSRGHST